jgi:hypothetical protein
LTDVSVVNVSKQYVADANVAKNRRSALRLIQHLLAMDGLTDAHRKEQLSLALWKWTEAEGVRPNAKYNTRYCSAGVMTASSPTQINHEHVWTRKHLVTELLARPWSESELENLLIAKGVACIVTVEEHGKLGGTTGQGWTRYVQAMIPVYDRATERWRDLETPRTRSTTPVTLHAIPERPAVTPTIEELIDAHASEKSAPLLLRLQRMARFASAVAVPSFKKSGQIARYYRIHDSFISEPTRAVAYPHWTGKVDFALKPEDIPLPMLDDPRVRILRQPTYAVRCTLKDEESLAIVEELLFLALEKVRAEAGSW